MNGDSEAEAESRAFSRRDSAGFNLLNGSFQWRALAEVPRTPKTMKPVSEFRPNVTRAQ
jgi:hypothetical protein